MSRVKVGRNSPCPCGRLRKYKQCCEGKLDWEQAFQAGADWKRHLSVRGRNIHFANRLAEILQLDSRSIKGLKDYKAAFTPDAVRRIYESVLDLWPPDLNIAEVLTADAGEVSGLYIGDYAAEYITRGIVRHSIYANKILLVDPFLYPRSVRDEFNPILEPEQHRAQTLRNANLWFTFLPWIEAGIVEVIRTPADFDPRLNWESMNRQRKKFSESEELTAAAEISVKEMKSRHAEKQINRQLLLSSPDSYIEKVIKDLDLEKAGYTANDFLQHIKAERECDPDFLEPLGAQGSQLQMFSSGASYEIAQITANLTSSYLVTDMYVRWREIELDRESHNAESKMWSPFAKALQESPLRYLNSIRLEHAFKLRQEGRLESLRSFFMRVWKSARTEDVFDSVNAHT